MIRRYPRLSIRCSRCCASFPDVVLLPNVPGPAAETGGRHGYHTVQLSTPDDNCSISDEGNHGHLQ